MNKQSPYQYKIPLGVHEARIGESAAWELLEYLYRPRIERHKPMFNATIHYNMAHTIMLAEQEIISREDAAALLRTLQGIEEGGIEAFNLDLEAQDIHPNMEAFLINKLGENVGGKILTGRSRADAQYTPDRMILRNRTLEALEEIIKLREVLLPLAQKHLETVMPTYTNMQSAQPGTFAHYIVSYIEALETDFDRLEASYQRLCLSPAEIGIHVGTTYPVNRERVATLLGFGGILENARRALSSTDIELETMSHLTIAIIHLSRLADDFYIWSSQEFGMVELADRYCSSSFIMPQKKNPKALDMPKMTAISMQEKLMTAFNLFRMTPSAHHQYAVLPSPLACETVEEGTKAFKMMRGVLDSLMVHSDRMRYLAGAYYAQATDIADVLVREQDFSFRAAHRTVGKAIRQAIMEKKSPKEFTINFLDAASQQLLNRPTGLSQERLNQILDPVEGVRLRRVVGGTAPEIVAASIESHRLCLVEKRKRLVNYKERLVRAEANLKELVKRYAA